MEQRRQSSTLPGMRRLSISSLMALADGIALLRNCQRTIHVPPSRSAARAMLVDDAGDFLIPGEISGDDVLRQDAATSSPRQFRDSSYSALLEDSFFSGASSLGSILASKTTSKNPIIISSQLWSPHFTSFVASGLLGLFTELS